MRPGSASLANEASPLVSQTPSIAPVGAASTQKARVTGGERVAAILLGASVFVFFFAMVQTGETTEKVAFPDGEFLLKVQVWFSSGQLFMTTVLLFVGRRFDPVRSIIASLFVLVACGIMFPVATFWLPQLISPDVAMYTYLAVAAILQGAVGVGMSNVFGLTSFLHFDLPGYAALGIAVAGLNAFILTVVFISRTSDVVYVIIHYGTSLAIVAAALLALRGLISSPWASIKVADLRAAKMAAKRRPQEFAEDVENNGDNRNRHAKGRSFWGVFWSAPGPFIAIFTSMWTLFTIYPSALMVLRDSPAGFGSTMAGLHFVGEACGRMLVTYHVLVPEKLLVPFAFARVLFIPLLHVVLKLSMDHFLRSPVFLYGMQMVQAISMGWIVSCGFVLAPSKFNLLEDRNSAGVLATVMSNYGIPVGSLFCYLLFMWGYFPRKVAASIVATVLEPTLEPALSTLASTTVLPTGSVLSSVVTTLVTTLAPGVTTVA